MAKKSTFIDGLASTLKEVGVTAGVVTITLANIAPPIVFAALPRSAETGDAQTAAAMRTAYDSEVTTLNQKAEVSGIYKGTRDNLKSAANKQDDRVVPAPYADAIQNVTQLRAALDGNVRQELNSLSTRIMLDRNISELDMRQIDVALQGTYAHTGRSFFEDVATLYSGHEQGDNIMPSVSFNNAFRQCQSEVLSWPSDGHGEAAARAITACVNDKTNDITIPLFSLSAAFTGLGLGMATAGKGWAVSHMRKKRDRDFEARQREIREREEREKAAQASAAQPTTPAAPPPAPPVANSEKGIVALKIKKPKNGNKNGSGPDV